jgi:hypothetical protein
MVPLSDTYFANLTQDAGAENAVKWEQEIARAESLRHIDVAEMDVMASRGPHPGDVPNAESVQAGKAKAAPDWVSLGVDIEDRQWVYL